MQTALALSQYSFRIVFNTYPLFKTNTAVRSGDYYLFRDLDEKIELDLINERASAGIEDTMAEKKLADKMTMEQVGARDIYINFRLSAWRSISIPVINICT